MRWLFSGGLLLLLFFSRTTVSEAAPVPPVPTLPLSSGLVKMEENGSLQNSNPANQYIQVTPSKTNQKGAVWFNQPISFENDFDIEMYVYIQSGGTGDGMGVLLKDSSETSTWIGGHRAGTLGIYGPETLPSKPVGNDFINGAIPKSFAIEFDNYDNKNGMDYSDAITGNHVAFSYPGLPASYSAHYDGLWPFGNNMNVLKHNQVQQISLATGTWKKFTMKYSKSANQLTYQYEGLAAVSIPNFVGGSETAKETFASGKAFLGFAGATGADAGAVQEMAVTFTKVPNVLDMNVEKQIWLDNEAPFFDSNTLKDTTDVPQVTLKNKDSVLHYKDTLVIDPNSSLSSIGKGTFTIQATKGINFDEASFQLDGQPVSVTFDEQKQEYHITSMSDIGKGTHTLTYNGKPQLDQNGNLDLTVNADTQVTGATYGTASLPQNRNSQALSYQVKAVTSLSLKESVQRIYGTHQGVIWESPNPLTTIEIGTQQERLQETLEARVSTESTIENPGNAKITLPISPSLNINPNTITVNGVVLPANQVSKTDSALIIDTKQPLSKDKAVTIKYTAIPEAFKVDQKAEAEANFSAQLTGDIGSATLNGTTTLIFNALPEISINQARPFNQLDQLETQRRSIKNPLLIVGSDKDENSTTINYYVKDFGDQAPTSEYQPNGDQSDILIGQHSNREALNNGKSQNFSEMTFPKDAWQKLGAGIHYFAIYGTDPEKNVSNVHYLKVNIVSDKLTLDRVPNLNFNSEPAFNSNQIAMLPGEADTVDYPLRSFEVKNQLNAYDGDTHNDGQILVTDSRTDRSKPWELKLKMTDIQSLTTKKSLSDQAAVVLQLAFKDNPNSFDILYSNFENGSVEIKDLAAPEKTISVSKEATVLTASTVNSDQDIIQASQSIDLSRTFLRFKKGSQSEFTKADHFQLKLEWVLSTPKDETSR